MLGRPIFLLLCLGQTLLGSNWRPSEDFLGAVRYVESSNGRFLHGDGGQSLGDFQISEAAWIDVSAWRKARKLQCYSYDQHVFNRKINRIYAADYMTILHGELKKNLKRAPTSGELYAAYNIGLSEFARCKYRLTRVNRVTRRKCQQIALIMDVKAQAQATSASVGGRS
jgi:hypothetical protein